jgi:phage gp36-like protein
MSYEQMVMQQAIRVTVFAHVYYLLKQQGLNQVVIDYAEIEKIQNQIAAGEVRVHLRNKENECKVAFIEKGVHI